MANVIKNKATKSDPRTDLLRSAIEHRATWFGLMIEEAEKKGIDISFAKEAVFKCGCFHGQNKFPRTDDLKAFAAAFANEDVVNTFEMDVTCSDTEFSIDFHYCPLVAAWEKLGIDVEKFPALCDAAMDGDRGIINEYDAFEFELGKTIAKGDDICEVRIRKIK